MAENNPCDIAILKASVQNPEVKDALQQMMRAQHNFAAKASQRMDEVYLEAHIPSPDQADMARLNQEYAESLDAWLKTQPPEVQKRANVFLKEVGGYGKLSYDMMKQMRVALMLSSPLTHIKNAVANSGQAFIVRPAEEALAIAISKLPGGSQREFTELQVYGRSMLRAAREVPSVFAAMAKYGKAKGTVQADEVRRALREAGYPEDLAIGKPELMIGGTVDLGPSDNPMTQGLRYLFNAAFGSQFSALQMMDTAFKMISHRSKVEQLIARQGIREGLTGHALDEYVSKNWNTLGAKNMAQGEDVKVLDDLLGVEKQGIGQAAEDTFTETPQTRLGSFMVHGPWGKNPKAPWEKAVHETMQIISPFRAIYVNLMRQSLSRRLVQVFDQKSRMELFGKAGKEAQEMAFARMGAAWTLFLGTGALVSSAGLKLWGPDDLDPRVRDLQYKLYGKVGQTIEADGFYMPIDALPPSIGIPLGYWASVKDGILEFNDRYVDDESFGLAVMRGVVPLMHAVTEGPWVTDYMGFLNASYGHLTYGTPGGFGKYLLSMTAAPLKTPNWIKSIIGGDPYLKTSDGLISKFKTDLAGLMEGSGYRRNMFGQRILPLQKFGTQSEYQNPWAGGSTDVVDFLTAIRYDEAYPHNISMKIRGDADGLNGVPKGRDDVPMPAAAQDRFEYYVGQARNRAGHTLEDELRMLMRRPGIYNFKSGELRANPVEVQERVSDILTRRREEARELIKYHPAFKLRERSIELFYTQQLKSGVPKREADRRRDMALTEIRYKRQQYSKYYQ